MAAELSEKAKVDAVHAAKREDALRAWEYQPWADEDDDDEELMRQAHAIHMKRYAQAFRAGYDAGVKDASSQSGVITGVDHATGTATISTQDAQIAGLFERCDIDASQVVKLTERVRELEQRLDGSDTNASKRVTQRVFELEKQESLLRQSLQEIRNLVRDGIDGHVVNHNRIDELEARLDLINRGALNQFGALHRRINELDNGHDKRLETLEKVSRG